MSLELLNNPLTGNFKDWDKPWENENFQDKFPEFPKTQENTSRRKSFEEISFERKFGEENKCIETNLGKFFSGQMRIDELINDLYDNQYNNDFFFNFGNYATNYGFALNNKNPDMILTMIKNASADFSKSVKYKYQTNEQYTREADISVELNLMPCLVDITQPGFEYTVDASSQSINYHIEYIYSNYIKLRQFDDFHQKYTLENKYRAISINSKNGDDFLAIVNDNFKKTVKTKIIENFVNELKSTTTPEGLKFLYENMPSFVLEKLKNYLPDETLWQHLISLTRYDDQGFFSFFKDASGALIKLLRAFKNSKFLYDKFKADQTLIKTIFNNLDDVSEIDGEITTNKLAFASFLSALCLYNGMEGLRILDKTFISNQDYIFNSSDNLSRDEKDNEFYLQQLKKTIIKSTEIIPDDLPRMVERVPVETSEFLPTEKGNYYHPLDIVYLKDSTADNALVTPVAAILIKAIADERERIEREKAIRIGFDVLAIVLGVITIATTANSGVLALAIADITLAGGDIAVQSAATDLQKTKEGQEFLKAWENIYLIGGIVTAGPVLIENIFTLGGKLFLAAKAVKNFKAINFVKACLIKVILERNIANFGKNTVTLAETNLEIVNATKGFFNEFKFSYLTKQNIFLVTNDSTEEVALVYRGEAIIKGKTTDKAFKEKMLELSRVYYNEKKLIAYIESIINRRRIVSVEDVELLGQPPKSGTKMLFSLLDEFGNRIGQLSRSPNKSELYYKLIQNGKEIDIKCYMKLLDDKYKLNDLPIKDGEHLLYGDFNIPKEITDKMSGLGQIMYEDGLKYFLNAKKYGKVDGTVSVWEKSTSYTDYGGQSINLEQFWKAVDIDKMPYEKAAFETFAGKQAKKFGFTKVRLDMDETIITKEKVQINFLK